MRGGRYNEILVGRYNRFLQKLFSMKGGAPVPQLSGDVQTSLALFSGVENRVLEAFDRFGQALNIPASAANLGGVRVRNPGGSNTIAVIEKCSFSESATDQAQVSFGTDTTDLATVVSILNTALDRRSRPNPSLIMSRQNTAAAVPALASTTALWNNFLLGNTVYDLIWDENQELILTPGMAIQITATLVNTPLTSAWVWRERFLEESERT